MGRTLELTNERQPHPTLRVYTLGTIPFDEFLTFQRRLVYDISGDPTEAAIVICDHPPGISIGRDGSRADVRLTPEELTAREWPVRWVSRGGGCILHLPGQLCIYPFLPIAEMGLTAGEYVRTLTAAVADIARATVRPIPVRAEPATVAIGSRRVAQIGAAIRSGVSSFGAVLNVRPDLELYRGIDCDGDPMPMTSLFRESPNRVHIDSVREDAIEILARHFGYERHTIIYDHPALRPPPRNHANIDRRCRI